MGSVEETGTVANFWVATHDVARDAITQKVALYSLACTHSITTLQTSFDGASAVQITSGSPDVGRRYVLITNTDQFNQAYIGASGVTAATGMPIQPGAPPLFLPLGQELALYGIADAGKTVSVAVLELG